MTLIINDDNKCICGAYFNSNGWCSNGHLIVKHSELCKKEKKLKKKKIEKFNRFKYLDI